jgi:hypothetical protein
MIGLILLGILFIAFGVLELKFPEKVLRISDLFRVRDGVEYTDFAIFMTKFSGVAMIIGGIVLIFFAFKINSIS